MKFNERHNAFLKTFKYKERRAKSDIEIDTGAQKQIDNLFKSRIFFI